MATFLTILLIIDVLVLIILIVGLQQGSEGGMGSAFGSGNSAGFFGASGGVSFIVKATWTTGTLFFVLAFSLAWLKTHDHFGVGREVNRLLDVPAVPTAAPEAGAATPNAVVPAPETSAPATPNAVVPAPETPAPATPGAETPAPAQ